MSFFLRDIGDLIPGNFMQQTGIRETIMPTIFKIFWVLNSFA